MEAALIGAAGGLVVVLVTVLYNLVAEQRRQAREDVVWRREHALAAASELLQAAGLVHVLTRTIGDVAELVDAAQRAGRPESRREHLAKLETYRVQRDEQDTLASNALARLSLLLSQEGYLACSLYLEAVHLRPHDPDTTGLGVHLNNVLRQDIGLPARVIPEGTGITVEQYRAKIAELRERPAT